MTDAKIGTIPRAMPRTISVKIVFVARFRELFAGSIESCELQQGETVRDVVAQLQQKLGQQADVLSAQNTLYAINQQICEADSQLADGDELAIMPPVTGG